MKVCTKCNESKSLEDFTRNKNHRDGRSYECRACKARYNVEYMAAYSKGPGRAEASRDYRRDRRTRNMRRAQHMKMDRGCEHCGLRPDDPARLHWDHIDPATKHQTSFAGAYRSVWSWPRIERELALCQVLCIPCHSRKTHREQQVAS